MSGFVGIDDTQVEFGDIVSNELATLIRQNVDYLAKVIPVGHIAAIMTNIPGVPAVNSDIWQECDGSEITNPNSPLRSTGGVSRYTPDMTDRYVKSTVSLGDSGVAGGTSSASFSHNHGGATGDWCEGENVDNSVSLFNVASCHNHSIASDLTSTMDMNPPFYTVKFYMKIQ